LSYPIFHSQDNNLILKKKKKKKKKKTIGKKETKSIVDLNGDAELIEPNPELEKDKKKVETLKTINKETLESQQQYGDEKRNDNDVLPLNQQHKQQQETSSYVFTGKLVKKFQGHSSTVMSVAYSPNGQFIASGSAGSSICLWDVNSGKLSNQFKGHSNLVWSVAFSPDGQFIVSGSDDKSVRLWDVNSGKEIIKLEGHHQCVNIVAFSPDGGSPQTNTFIP